MTRNSKLVLAAMLNNPGFEATARKEATMSAGGRENCAPAGRPRVVAQLTHPDRSIFWQGDVEFAEIEDVDRRCLEMLTEFVAGKYHHGTTYVWVGVRTNSQQGSVSYRHVTGTCRIAYTPGSWDVHVYIGLTDGCKDCLVDSAVHEFAHALWWIKQLNKCRSQDDIMRTLMKTGTEHSDAWGMCYSEIWRAVEVQIAGKVRRIGDTV
jgi:hypothetical protein